MSSPRWATWALKSPMRVALSIGAIVVVSMAAGGAVVAAAYQSQSNERREVIAASYASRLALAQRQLVIAADALKTAKRRVAVGLATNAELMDEEFKVVEAEAVVRTVQLQLEEIRLTGQEPVTAVSAPLVDGRDFVSERWQAEMLVPEKALEMQRHRQRDAERRFSIGVADALEIEIASARATELGAALNGFKQRLEIRRRFVNKEIDATQADLRILEAEAFQRRATLATQHEMAQREVDRVAARVKKGLATEVELAQANLKLLSLHVDLQKAELDYTLIRMRLKGKD